MIDEIPAPVYEVELCPLVRGFDRKNVKILRQEIAGEVVFICGSAEEPTDGGPVVCKALSVSDGVNYCVLSVDKMPVLTSDSMRMNSSYLVALMKLI